MPLTTHGIPLRFPVTDGSSSMFRRIVFSACLAGLVAGLVLTAVQMVRVTPIIVQAETYETASPQTNHTHTQNAQDAHAHSHEAWAPADGIERTFWTASSNVLSAIGFALVLAAIYSLRKRVTWWQGVLWGGGGFVVFFVTPAVGLSPEIPGAMAAELSQRQAWWLLTVLGSAAGLALVVFNRVWGWKLLGVGLLLVPHVIGAPQPELYGGNAPQALADAFVMAATVANGVFWVVLGVATAVAFKKLA